LNRESLKKERTGITRDWRVRRSENSEEYRIIRYKEL